MAKKVVSGSKKVDRLLFKRLYSKETHLECLVLRIIPTCDQEQECEKFLYEIIERGKKQLMYLTLEEISSGYFVDGKCEKTDKDEQ